MERDENNHPLNSDCKKNAFFKYYFTYDANQFSENLLTNVDGLADKCANFWNVIAKYFKNEPNILGYELLNEPWGVSLWNEPLDFVWPGINNDKYLLPFYRILNKKIREVDDETIVFYEPYVSDLLNGGYKENVGGINYRDREVFSYHVYCPTVDSSGTPTY